MLLEGGYMNRARSKVWSVFLGGGNKCAKEQTPENTSPFKFMRMPRSLAYQVFPKKKVSYWEKILLKTKFFQCILSETVMMPKA